MHGQNIICSKTHLDNITHEQTTICYAVISGSKGKRKKKCTELLWELLLFHNSDKNDCTLICLSPSLRTHTAVLYKSFNKAKCHGEIFHEAVHCT